MLSVKILFAVLLAAGLWWAMRKPGELKVITVIDGDTCIAVDPKGVRRKLRLVGVDAPENGQRLSAEARDFLRAELLNRWSRVRWYGQDRYRRHLVRLTGRNGDVSAGLLRKGLAYPTKGVGLRLHALVARLTLRGVWLTGARPHDSLKRKYRVLGWLSWQVETRKRKKRSRKNARPR
jgi:endonuclease YncB( thermonuclease family)